MTRWIPRSLSTRLAAGLVALLALACLVVGVTTVVALRGFLLDRVDQQLAASDGRFAASLERGEKPPDADNRPDTRGQAEGTFGARVIGGEVAQAARVDDETDTAVTLTGSDRRALAAIPTDECGHTVTLSKLGTYRMVAVNGDENDVLVTGLPLHEVEETLRRLELLEGLLFAGALAVTGVASVAWVRVSLRPLRRVAATATTVTELPLASGEVAMPDPVPDNDPRTEVGQVGAALNRMLEHVGAALRRRHVSEERLRRFAADASHELRTPVATVRAHAELALRQPEAVPESVRHALRRIQSETERMSRLVEDLLLLARLDAGRPLARESVDLTRIALDATEDAQIARPGHHWELDLPPEPVIVTGDDHRLHQVVANLLTNAGTHTPSGTNVLITLSKEDKSAVLAVVDDGPGIPEPLRDKIFDRFARGDQARSRAGGNTGLGLAISAAILQAHGGTIEVTSRPGRTEFRVRLPLDHLKAGAAGRP